MVYRYAANVTLPTTLFSYCLSIFINSAPVYINTAPVYINAGRVYINAGRVYKPPPTLAKKKHSSLNPHPSCIIHLSFLY